MARKVIIIGSGPAGHTAAIYAARAELKPLMFEGMYAADVAAGGQLTTTTEIENFPGYTSIGGPELMEKMREQSIHNGAEILTETVDQVDLSVRPYRVLANEIWHEAETLIIATGATAKRMKLPGEDVYWQKGISACAVCDGGLPMFRNKPMVVVGGGDTACEEANYLTKYASHVHLVVRRDVMRASKAMQERTLKNPKITVHWNTLPLEAKGNGKSLTHVAVETKGKGQWEIEAAGLFYAIGHTPNTSFLGGQIKLDENGYILTEPGTTKTSVEAVFAAGDVQDHKYRQAITSAGTGCMAAMDAEHYLASHS
ncbi:MAG: thioredoxin reductase [Verrucomicrobiota bacterium]|jgi:thioredoxin reductase (NADPH)